CWCGGRGGGQRIAGGGRGRRRGLQLLEAVAEVAIVAAPGFVDPHPHDALLTHCENLKDRVAILDPPPGAPDLELLKKQATVSATVRRGRTTEGAEGGAEEGPPGQGLMPRPSERGYGAFYFPQITARDPLGTGELVDVAPSGHIAGIWARSDAMRGVHKAPANELVRGALNVTYNVTREEQAELNALGINCIRLFAREGIRVWGARTLADAASEWRYLNVRRLFNMIEESIA